MNSPFRRAQSYLTGRTIYINTSAEFAVPPTFSADRMSSCAEEIAHRTREVSKKNPPAAALRAMLADLKSISDPVELLNLVNRLFQFAVEEARPHDNVHVRECLRKLWHFDLLTWPSLPNQNLKIFSLTKKWGWEPERKKLWDSLASVFPGQNGQVKLRGVMTLVLASAGSKSLSDFTPEVVGDYFYSCLPSAIGSTTVVNLISLQYLEHGSKVIHGLKDYGSFGRSPIRSDDSFQWALSKDHSLVTWVDRATKFMTTIHSNRTKYRTAYNYFFDFLIENASVTRSPEEYLKRDYVAPALFLTPKAAHAQPLSAFFEYILETHCTEEDDYGGKVRIPGYYNPVSIPENRKRPAETHREAMPTRFVRMLHDILVADDFAWPREFGKPRWNGHGGDTFMWLNPETAALEPVWSPVRTIAILIKLLLPARTFQVRMLDSGEADSSEYDLHTNSWVENVGHLTPPKGESVAKGVFARHRDKDGREFVFIRFNTNKTSDKHKDPEDAGYIMPWQHTEAIRLLAYLRDWQKKYNPISTPTRWVDVKDIDISSRYSREVLESKGSNCFLFRDPCLPLRNQAVTDSRLSIMWRNLNLELERRLALAGETMPDGSPLVMVEKTAAGRPVYDLHTLRVTLITALAESGGVPPAVLMKVVGHASVIMTLYYMKLSPSHICEQLNEAELRLHNQEQMNWQAWLKNQKREALGDSVAFSAPTALDAMATSSPTSWTLRDHGICPVSCARCHEGGEVIVESQAMQKWAPVPGGASNCVQCRFFITGPAFLLGLQAYFDNIGFRLREASEQYQRAKANFETLEAAYIATHSSGKGITKKEVHDLTVASSNFDQRTREVDILAHSWHAAYKLIQQCLHIIKTSKDKSIQESQHYALVAVGGLANVEAVLEQSSDFELVDRICQSAVFFEGIDSTLPNLKRMRAFDAMLKRNGLQPVFVELDEASALEAGNQMAAFMYSRFGRESTNAVMAGKQTLQRLGIEVELMQKIESIIPSGSNIVLPALHNAVDAPSVSKINV